MTTLFQCLLFIFCWIASFSLYAQPAPLEFSQHIRPVLDQHCFNCHNVGKVAGGINLEKYENEGHMLEDGEVWLQAVKQVQSGQMPPDTEPSLTPEEKEILVKGINEILVKSLKENNPGRVVVRRLSHEEYHYTILDMLGVDFEATVYFPSDGSGGAGFNNYAKTLFVTPLKLERYYDAAEIILDQAYADPELWHKLVPNPYQETWWQRFTHWITSFFSNESATNRAVKAAEEVILPFASQAYRRFLKPEEKTALLDLFRKIYEHTKAEDRFNQAVLEIFRAVLVSPNFLYRVEEEQPVDLPYALSNFELASRLSYFLWSSLPDQQLFDAAYRQDLHDPAVLNVQVRRMLQDPKAKRFSESFATQWFGVSRLKETNPVDPERFPTFTPSLRQAMYQEMVEYFHHVLTESRNFLDLIDSDYTFLNEDLAQHYGIRGVEGDRLRKVRLQDRTRGGVLGMGSVLASTSLPLRTSPVLRGKWVLEEIMGTPPPPPPPDAGDLPEEEADKAGASLRDLLAVHRSSPNCMSCHKKMDPIGFGMENYDATGRWRTAYGAEPIIAWDTLASGEVFDGPVQLKEILMEKKENFARTLSEKMFTYAIGRSVEFVDEPTMQNMVNNLLKNDFNPEALILELVNSYPFRYKVNDYGQKFKVL